MIKIYWGWVGVGTLFRESKGTVCEVYHRARNSYEYINFNGFVEREVSWLLTLNLYKKKHFFNS